MRRGGSWVLACLVFLAFEPAARAAPVVSIQAHTDVEVDPIRRSDGRIRVSGRVVDRSSREPVPFARVTIQLDDESRNPVGNQAGEFSASFRVSEGKHNLRIDFSGTRIYTPSAHEIRDFDIDKDPLTLEVQTDKSIDFGQPAAVVTVKAGVDTMGVALAVQLRVGAHDAKTLEPVGTVTTNANGRGRFEIPRAKLGGPGSKRVEVVFAGDATYDAAGAQTTFMVVTKTKLVFELATSSVAHESSVRASGTLTDASGAPIARGPIAMLVGDRRMAEVLSASDGTFKFRVAASEIGKGKFNVQGVFEPTKRWRRGSRSEPALVTISEPRPVPIRYTIAAFGLTAFAMVAFFALRSRPWERWLARLRRQDATSETRDDEREGVDAPPVRTGLSHARPGLVSTLRRANDNGFSGTVRDAVRGRVLSGAHVHVEHDSHGERSDTTAGDGSFEIGELEAGTWDAVVTRSGYCAERFRLSIPHRGELRGARIDMLPVREKVFAMYREVARPLLPEAKLWGVWTPRQIFDHVREARPASALSALTDFVEETYFSQRTPDEHALLDAATLIDGARGEISPQPPDFRPS